MINLFILFFIVNVEFTICLRLILTLVFLKSKVKTIFRSLFEVLKGVDGKCRGKLEALMLKDFNRFGCSLRHITRSRSQIFVDSFKISSLIFSTACVLLVFSSEGVLGGSRYTISFKCAY